MRVERERERERERVESGERTFATIEAFNCLRCVRCPRIIMKPWMQDGVSCTITAVDTSGRDETRTLEAAAVRSTLAFIHCLSVTHEPVYSQVSNDHGVFIGS